jgi:enoyl-CoA hydratase/carnithine racemase
MTELVLVQHESNTLTLVMNRPDSRNALSHELLTALREALSGEFGPDISRVFITGAGDCFSAGADFRELNGTIDDLWIDDDIAMVTRVIRSLSLPVIAAVNGPCIGGAVDIALSCDQRRASGNAYFQVPATKLGVLYNPVAVKRMVERYGSELMRRILADGERFDASSALQAGIVSRVIGDPNDRVPAQKSADNEPGKVTMATKEMIEAIARGEFDPEYWEQVRREILNSDERRNAIAAFKACMQSGRG